MEERFNYEEIKEAESLFFSLEEEYIKELLKNPKFHKYLARYFAYSNKNLLELFSRMQEQMENGEIKETDEDSVELSMIACILAMSEKVKQLIKAKYHISDEVEEVHHERSH